jgi:uncharacterized membrane protein YdcZ (DUF606 family)
MKNNTFILFLAIVLVLFIVNGAAIAQITDSNYLLIREMASNMINSNNGLFQGIIVLLVIIIFGYSAKLFYEKKFGKE